MPWVPRPAHAEEGVDMKWYFQALSKYADFRGRARRKEYWSFFLWNMVIAFTLGFIEAASSAGNPRGGSGGALVTLYQLAILLPSIAVAVRRMHDTDRSGWWTIVPIASLVLTLTEGTRGPNRFGEDPKVADRPAAEALAGAESGLTAAASYRP
jgi:uncharacterized membrane protein YhaH (DUF805 family)